jgi:hypothetical protein
LGKAEDDLAVCIAVIVGDGDRLDDVFLAANVAPQNPFAGDGGPATATSRPPVADVQPFLDRSIIGLASRLEPQPSLASAELRVLERARHDGTRYPRLTAVTRVVSNRCPIYMLRHGETSKCGRRRFRRYLLGFLIRTETDR